MSETPIYDELAKKYGFVEKLTDSQIEGRDEVVADDRIDIHEVDTINPDAFEVAEINHEVVQSPQPPTYEAPSHSELLRRSIEASPGLVLVKDITDIGEALGTVRHSQLAA